MLFQTMHFRFSVGFIFMVCVCCSSRYNNDNEIHDSEMFINSLLNGLYAANNRLIEIDSKTEAISRLHHYFIENLDVHGFFSSANNETLSFKNVKKGILVEFKKIITALDKIFLLNAHEIHTRVQEIFNYYFTSRDQITFLYNRLILKYNQFIFTASKLDSGRDTGTIKDLKYNFMMFTALFESTDSKIKETYDGLIATEKNSLLFNEGFVKNVVVNLLNCIYLCKINLENVDHLTDYIRERIGILSKDELNWYKDALIKNIISFFQSELINKDFVDHLLVKTGICKIENAEEVFKMLEALHQIKT